jgi:hypothetical protein
MTRYHRPWDRRGRLLAAVQKLIVGIIIASDASVVGSDKAFSRPRNPDAERLYVRSKKMVARIKRELSRG